MDLLSLVVSIILRLVVLICSIPIVFTGFLYDRLVKKLPPEPHTILIVGGNSGICKEIALQMSKPNNHIILVARNLDRLNRVAEDIQKNGATVTVASIDACDTAQMKKFIQEQDDQRPIDLVVAGAGIITVSNSKDLSLSDIFECIINNNVITCKNSILPLVERMRRRRKGQICIISSIAGLGMKFVNPMYSSTKMATFAFGEALRCMLSSAGVYVSIACPGPTDTPILDTNNGKRVAYKLQPQDVASIIISGLRRDYAVIECTMLFNLATAFIVRDIPQLAREYIYRIAIPIARKRGFFVTEYPSLG